MKTEELLAAGLCVLLGATPVMEGMDRKPYRKAPPHTENKLLLSELFSDDVQAANSTIRRQAFAFYDYNVAIYWPQLADRNEK